MIRIAIAEDNPFLAKTLIDSLDIQENVKIKHVSSNGVEMLQNLESDSFVDVILMDIDMPLMNGIETTEKVSALYPQIKIMMLTVLDDDQNIFDAICSGAQGYLLKDEPVEKLLEGIVEIMDNGAPMTPGIALKALKLLRDRPNEELATKDFGLSKREIQVLEQLSKGLSYSQIAENLVISPNTVRTHIEHVYAKLNAHNKVEAIDIARKNRLV